MMTPEQALLRGADILREKLYPLGFAFEIIERGMGSGGDFATGRFKNGDREISLWFRWHLGSVSYCKGDVRRDHAQYMGALGRERDARFPGFHVDDALAGFRDLLGDLRYCDGFLLDDGKPYYDLMKGHQDTGIRSGFAALSRVAGRRSETS